MNQHYICAMKLNLQGCDCLVVQKLAVISVCAVTFAKRELLKL